MAAYKPLSVDINSDMGESYGAWVMGDDEQMLPLVTSANLACGFHAGDPDVMAQGVAKCLAHGVAIGAHPGYNDPLGFGRRIIPMAPLQIERMVAYQIGALAAVAALEGGRVTHVKAHGALSNLAARDAAVADAIARAVKAVDQRLILLAVTGTEIAFAGERVGLEVAFEIYADRAYLDDGQLMPRSQLDAVLHDPEAIAQRAAAMVLEGVIICHSGKRLPVPISSICVHGDTPGAVAIAQRVRQALTEAAVAIAPFAAGEVGAP